jgi:hypothetical protein
MTGRRFPPSLTAAQTVANAEQARNMLLRYAEQSVACPKSFASAWRNCPAHVEKSAQWRAGFQTWNQMGAIMTIAEYLAATALIALIVWAVLGLLMQES